MESKSWIFSCNSKRYSVVQAFKDLGTVDWLTDKNVAQGDYVYIYLGSPVRKIIFKTEVRQVGILPEKLIDDSKYVLAEDEKAYEGKYVRLQSVLELLDAGDQLEYQHLRKNGLNGTIRGPILLNNNIYLWNYIKSVENASNMVPYKKDEIEKINELDNLISLVAKETEKQSMIRVRIGQGEFKKKLMTLSCQCGVCGLNIKDLLIASHIKPWKDCTNEERLDTNNGFLLCSMHDALFDKGYISFTNKGTMLISSDIQKEHYELLGIKGKLNFNECGIKTNYLKWHRDNIFRK